MSDPALSRQLLDVGLGAARRGAALIRSRRPSGRVDVTMTKSSPTDVVTAIDTATEQLLRAALHAERPDDGIVGEEGDDVAGASGVRWVLDPIDGTVNFVYGIPAYAVSVAAEVAGECRAGIVLDVVSGEEFTAVLGEGAWLRPGAQAPARRLVLPAPPGLARALVATGFGYDAERRRQQASAVARLLPQVRDVRRIGAASLDLCNVAAGRVDAYVEQGLQPWDIAAGALIAREVGAVVSGFDGAAPSERLVVSCAPPLYGAFSALVRECGF